MNDTVSSEPTRRYSLSKEDFAQERIRIVKDTVRQIRDEHPEVLSFCMFGSMVKGTLKPTSDIDGYLFVDVGGVEVSGKDASLNVKSDDQYQSHSVTTRFNEVTQATYSDMIREPLKTKLGLTDEQVKHVRVLAIDDNIIDDRLNDLLPYADAMRDYDLSKDQYKVWLDDPKKDWSKEPERPEMPEIVHPGSNLTAMFHLDVGGGIGKYRTYLIDKLAAEGERGEYVWRQIIEGTESLEQNLNWNTNLEYPRTLDEARKVYGTVNGSDKISL